MRDALLAAALSLCGTSAQACSGIVDQVGYGPAQAVSHADWIARVQAVALPDGLTHRLEVITYLKGNGPDYLDFSRPITGLQSEADFERLHRRPVDWTEGARVTFSRELGQGGFNAFDHTNSKFWTEGATEASIWTDCRVHPNFVVGREYLVFGPLDYQYGFEPIRSEDDAWLEFVVDATSGETPRPPFPVPFEDYVADAHAIIRIEASLDGDAFDLEETVLKGDAESYLSELYILGALHIRDALRCRNIRNETIRSELDTIVVIEQITAQTVPVRQALVCLRDTPTEQRPNTLARNTSETVNLQTFMRTADRASVWFEAVDQAGQTRFQSRGGSPVTLEPGEYDFTFTLEALERLLDSAQP